MSYYIDLSKISLDEFKKKILKKNHIPGRKILSEQIDERFDLLKNQKLENMYQLQQVMKTKKNVQTLSETTSLPLEYLTLLRREIDSYHPQARSLRGFSCIKEKVQLQLERSEVKTTEDLYNRVAERNMRTQFRKKMKLNDKELLLLIHVADVSRLRYVNQDFVTLLMESDFYTVKKISRADVPDLYYQLININEKKNLYKGKIGLKEIEFLVQDTVNISSDMEY